MVITGIFVVKSLEEKDSEGFESVAVCTNGMSDGLEYRLYLLPHMRPSRCDIKAGSKVFGVADTVIGSGAALAGIDCDVNFHDKNNYTFEETLTVDKSVTMHDTLTVDKAVDAHDKLTVQSNITSNTGNIIATAGDCKATAISLLSHVHAVPTTPLPTATPLPPAPAAIFPGAVTTTPT